MALPLFELNPALDRADLARRFAADTRVQVRDVLTIETAITLRTILARHTPWGLAWQAGRQGPFSIGRPEHDAMLPAEHQRIGQALAATMRDGGYAFRYAQYPMLTAYQQRWDAGGPHDLILEHLNDAAFLDLTRAITGLSCRA